MTVEEAAGRRQAASSVGQKGTAVPAGTRFPLYDFLVVRGLSKAFGGNQAISELDFAASAGEVHGLLGENGAGKSTFTNILVGAIQPDAGTITLDGRSLGRFGLRQARRLGIVGVFQELAVLPDLTVAENVWLGREPRGRARVVRRSALVQRTQSLFAECGLDHLDPRREASSLELAQRQQVAIARALSHRPRVLILDEATSALASREAEWLVQTARRLATLGTLVLYISHRLAEVRLVADRLTVMRNGQQVLTAATRDVDDAQLVKAMLGRSPGRLYPEKSRTAPGDVVVSVKNLRSGHSLRGVDFELRAGEIVGLSGIQGQGQVELLTALVGLRLTQGDISVLGTKRSIRSPAGALLVPEGIALLPLERKSEGLLLSKSIKENVVLPVVSKVSSLGVIRKKKERPLAEQAVRGTQVRCESIDQPVWQLSGGNQQKVVLARLLTTKARVLLLADPVRGVDVGAKAEIFTIVRNLANAGYSILYYSSDVQELVNVADRVLVMSRGRIVASLAGDELDEEAILTASVSGRAWSGVAS